MLPACLMLGLLVPVHPPPVRQEPATHRAIGVVHDTDGRPLPGVAVAAKALVNVVAGSFEEHLETDADGAFEIVWATRGEPYCLELTIGGGGWESKCEPLLPRAGTAERELGPIVLARACPLELFLRDERGAPLTDGWAVSVGAAGGSPRSARLDRSAGAFRLDDVSPGHLEVAVTRAREPGPSFVTTVRHECDTTSHAIRVESRRQIWVRLDVPWPDRMTVPQSIYGRLVVLAVTADREEFEARPVLPNRLYLLDDLPDGDLTLVVEGASELRRHEAALPERGEVTAELRGSLDLVVVLQEQGGAGAFTDVRVDADVDVEVVEVEDGAARRVEGLVPGIGGFELSVPGADRPTVRVELSSLTAEERDAKRVVRTLPNWTGLRVRLVDRTPSAPASVDGVIVEILSVDENGNPSAAVQRKDLDRGARTSFGHLLPGPYVVRVWWAPRHWQDYPVVVEESPGPLECVREEPARFEAVHRGTWPAELGLVVRPAGAPVGFPEGALRPSSEGRFEPLELPPGDVSLGVVRRGFGGLPWELADLSVAPGPRTHAIDPESLPALIRWRVHVDGEERARACRGGVDPVGGTIGAKMHRLGTEGAREDCVLVSAGDFELVLRGLDGTWCARRDVKQVRPGTVRDLEIPVTRVRRLVRFLVAGAPLRHGEVEVEVETSEGILPTRSVRTDADGVAELVFMAGTMTVLEPGPDREPVSFDWVEDSSRAPLVVELR